MNRSDTGRPAGDEAPPSTTDEPGDDGLFERLMPYARRGLRSGLVAGVAGGALTVRGLGSLRRRKWGRALLQLFVGGLLLAAARAQWTGTSSLDRREREQTTVTSFVDSGPETADEGRSIDIESTGAVGAESETTSGAAPATATYERLGAAAFDEHSNEVPAPQQAFDRGLLSLGSEVAWGIRAADDHVLLSLDYDAIADREGVRYVASSQIDQERTVSVPDRISNHWDEMVESGAGIVGGEDIAFGISDDLAADHLLVVVPEERFDDLEWEE